MSNCPTIPTENLQGWILSIASGLACCLGASVVFSDLFFQRFLCGRYFLHDSSFMVASLSLGAGVMLFSSLYTMLNEARESFNRTSKEYAGIYLIAFYFLGVIGSAIINKLIHYFVLKDSHYHHHHHDHNNLHNIEGHNLLNNDDLNNERSPLLKNRMDEIIYYNHESDSHSVCVVESETEEPEIHHHSHSRNDQNEQLMQIGIQTALAISVHKFPEGLITFVTSKASPTLGFALFIAIALHNISEGFTIALPLYMATRSRIKSFLYASLLGGLSQPFGALIGFLFLKESELSCWDNDFVYGMLFAIVSGLMGVICIQGMLPQAIKNDRSDGHVVSIFFFVGVLTMGTSSALIHMNRPK